MRRWLVLAVGLIAAAGTTPAAALSLAIKATIGPPGWVLPHRPDIQFDFARGMAWRGAGTGGGAVVPPESLLTVTRASACLIDDLGGTWRTFPVNTLCRSNKGAAAWSARTNGIRNNTAQGVVAGSPGTMPTNYAVSGGTGLTRTISGPSSANGVDYFDLRFNGTAGSGNVDISFETAGVIAGLNGETWAVSAFLSIIGGSITNWTSATLGLYEYDSVPALIINHNGSDFKNNLSSASTRFEAVVTNTNATTAFVRPHFTINYTNGTEIDFTVRIGWPQAELGTFATSPIPTTTVAVTRAADVVNVTVPPTFGSAYSLLTSATPAAPATFGSTQQIVTPRDTASAVNALYIYRSPTSALPSYYGSPGDATESGSAWTSGVVGKIAVGFAKSDQQGAFNGTLMTPTSTATIPSGLLIVDIAHSESGELFNGHLGELVVWPTVRLPNGVLSGLTR